MEHVTTAPAVTYTAPAPLIEHVTPVSGVTNQTRAPVSTLVALTTAEAYAMEAAKYEASDEGMMNITTLLKQHGLTQCVFQ